MAGKRRFGREDSQSRAQLLDAAEQVMMENGYAAVSSRRVAEQAGLKPQLVHYYFRTMDDLFIALLDRSSENMFVGYTRALTSKTPMQAMWELSSDHRGATLIMEFMALANHRPAIREKMSRIAQQLRAMRTEVFRQAFEQHGVDPDEMPAEAMAIILEAVGRSLGLEMSLGVTTGHSEAMALIERFIARYELGANRE